MSSWYESLKPGLEQILDLMTKPKSIVLVAGTIVLATIFILSPLSPIYRLLDLSTQEKHSWLIAGVLGASCLLVLMLIWFAHSSKNLLDLFVEFISNSKSGKRRFKAVKELVEDEQQFLSLLLDWNRQIVPVYERSLTVKTLLLKDIIEVVNPGLGHQFKYDFLVSVKEDIWDYLKTNKSVFIELSGIQKLDENQKEGLWYQLSGQR